VLLPRLKRAIKSPAFLVGLAAFLTALLVQSGDVGSIDTEIRLQTTHSFWTEAPSVPDNSPEFGLAGKNGRVYATYGMGQSLLMLPSDIVGTYLARLRLFASFAGHDPGIREIVVSYSTSILLCVLAVLVSFRWLHLMGFRSFDSAVRYDLSPLHAESGGEQPDFSFNADRVDVAIRMAP